MCPDGHLRPRLIEVVEFHPLYRPASIAVAAVTTAAVPFYVAYTLAREAIRKARR